MPAGASRGVSQLMRAHAWSILIGAGLILTVAYFRLGQREQDAFYQLPETLATIAVLLGIRMHRPANARPWYLLAFGMGLTVTGDWTWFVLDRFYGVDPFPSIADGFYLAGMATVAIAVWGMLRGRIPGGDRAGLLDALIVTAGVGLITWTFLMEPIAADASQSPLELAVALAYPAIDLLLLGVLVRLVLAPGEKVWSLRLLIGGLVAFLLADYQYAVLALTDGYAVGSPIDAGWLLGTTLWGAAALHPSMRGLVRPTQPGNVLRAWRIALLAVASLLAPALLVVEWAGGMALDVPVIAGGCVVLFGLVIARLEGVVADLRRTLDERTLLERELERRALHDPLTGLANRVLFHDRLTHALARREGSVAVMFLDLDDFKTINDSFGHQAGDDVLRAVATRLADAARPADTIARLGGDEFAILVEDSPDRFAASGIAGRLLEAVREPMQVAGHARTIGASIGISLGAPGVADADVLMREADIAMYVAKGGGKGTFTVFEPSELHGVVRSLELRNDLEQAVRERQFELDYQPIFDLATGEMAGVEALVRWRHPQQGRLLPSEFIGLTETTGAIVPLGRWMLNQAARQAVRWDGPWVSVNLSAQQLEVPTFIDDVRYVLGATGLPPERLVLELTETARLNDEVAAHVIHPLREMGVRLALDDFGTGFAALSQLSRSWFDIVKIDRSFLASLTSDPRAESLVHGILDLARRLGVVAVAEGIEDGVQLARLREAGCPMGQGFHFARPMPPRELTAFLRGEGAPSSHPAPARRAPSA